MGTGSAKDTQTSREPESISNCISGYMFHFSGAKQLIIGLDQLCWPSILHVRHPGIQNRSLLGLSSYSQLQPTYISLHNLERSNYLHIGTLGRHSGALVPMQTCKRSISPMSLRCDFLI
jgi:hypothetical protein